MSVSIDPNKLDQIDSEVFEDLKNRIAEIDKAYIHMAEKAADLFMKAEEAEFKELTEMLDKPMRNASENQQAFSAIMEDLTMSANRRKQAAMKDAV